jgi:hypothetical protein
VTPGCGTQHAKIGYLPGEFRIWGRLRSRRSLRTLAGMFALVLVMFLGTVAAVNIFTFKDRVPLDVFFRIAVNGGLLASTFGAFSLLCAATFGRLYAAVGVSVGYLVANYFVAVVSNWWPRMAFLKRAPLFYLVDSSSFWQGWPLRNMAILATILLVAAGLGGVIWHRRDLPPVTSPELLPAGWHGQTCLTVLVQIGSPAYKDPLKASLRVAPIGPHLPCHDLVGHTFRISCPKISCLERVWPPQ